MINRIMLNLFILIGVLLIVLSVFQGEPVISAIELVLGIFLLSYNLSMLLINITIKSILIMAEEMKSLNKKV